MARRPEELLRSLMFLFDVAISACGQEVLCCSGLVPDSHACARQPKKHSLC